LLKLKRFVLLRSGNCIEVKSDMTNTPECVQSGVKDTDSRMDQLHFFFMLIQYHFQ